MLSILFLNPAFLASCICCFLVFIVLLRSPRWLGRRSSHARLISGLVVIGFIISLGEVGFQYDYKGLWTLSLGVSVSGAVVTYIYRRKPSRAFKIVCVAFTILVWVLFSYKMLRTGNLLDSDERQYLSISAVATGGHGFYPALQNFPSIPVQGGVGYMVWIYVLAYQILGPSIYSLRLAALLFSFLSIPPVFLLFRRWYGSVTAWLAMAILPVTLLYVTIFSTRMDIFTVTSLWWGLLLVVVARDKNRWPWHLVAGLWLGLCLEAHLHTSVTTIAVGLLYLVDYWQQVRATRRWTFPSAVLAYSIGALLGLGIFVVVTILPNAETFFRTAGNATRFAYMSIDPDAPLFERLIKSFTSVGYFADFFVRRWIIVIAEISPVELVLWIAAIGSLFWRRAHKATLPTIVLTIGALVAGFFILNHYVLIYTTHIGPILLLCVPPFFTYGASKQLSFEWSDITPGLVLVLSACVFPIYMTSIRLPDNMLSEPPAPPSDEVETINFVKEHVSTNCKVMGPDVIFIFDLPMYTWYHTSDNSLGKRYYDFTQDEQLWTVVDPDIVLTTEETLDTAKQWVVDMDYEEIGPEVWMKTHGPLTSDCRVTL